MHLLRITEREQLLHFRRLAIQSKAGRRNVQILSNGENVSLSLLDQARRRLEGIARHTPNLQSEQFDKKSGCRCFFKAENLQRTGSLSFRGIFNKLRMELDNRQIRNFVVKASEDVSLAAACSGQLLGIKSTLILPDSCAPHIISAAHEYGARVELYSKGQDHMSELLRKHSLSSDDFLMSDPEDAAYGAGEATAILELIEDVPDIQKLVLSATKPALIRITNELLNDRGYPINLFVVENASETMRFRKTENLTGLLQVSKEQASRTQFFLLQRMKTLVELSASACPAAILHQPDVFNCKPVGVILHSGNVNLHTFGDSLQDSESFFLNEGSEYFIDCYHCRESYNVAESVYCNCLTPERTFVCPRCLKCFCGAPKSYVEKFWEGAPQDIWDRNLRDRDLPAFPANNPLPYQAKHPLVLVVEPDPQIQHMAKSIIENFGYGIIVASEGQTGLQMATAYQPEFILTAALMPHLDGREMCRLIKELPKLKNTKVAVMTALYTQQKYRAEAFKRFHVDEYVSKPLRMDDLRHLLHKYLDRA